jgi:hypothetical protein
MLDVHGVVVVHAAVGLEHVVVDLLLLAAVEGL